MHKVRHASLLKLTKNLHAVLSYGFQRLLSVESRNSNLDDYQQWLKRYSWRTSLRARLLNLVHGWRPHLCLISVQVITDSPNNPSLQRTIDSLLESGWKRENLTIRLTHKPSRDFQRDSNFLGIRVVQSLPGEAEPKWDAVAQALNDFTTPFGLCLFAGDRVSLGSYRELHKAVGERPQTFALYTDYDQLDKNGSRSSPAFQSGFNELLYLTSDYIGRFIILNISKTQALGGGISRYGEAIFYKLVLTALLSSKELKIHHVANCAIQASPDFEGNPKKKTPLMRQALAEYFNQPNSVVTVTASKEYESGLALSFKFPDLPPLASIIIPTRDRVDLLANCIESIRRKRESSNYEIVVVDNGSREPESLLYFDELRLQGVVVLSHNSPFNFSELCNIGAAAARGEFLCFLNNDVEVLTGKWLNSMIGHSLTFGGAVVGARLWYPNMTLQHGGVILGIRAMAGHAHKHLAKGQSGYLGRAVLAQEFSAVTGACLLVPRAVFLSNDGFDESLAVGLNDVELCLRLSKQGIRALWDPNAELMHYESLSRGKAWTATSLKRAIFETIYVYKKWHSLIRNDPFYNKNLTRFREDFGFRWN